eukprot:g27871.t1
MNSAYPKYSDVDFNGGNLQVDSNGQITIRFQAPATPTKDTFAHTTQDAIVFIVDGPELVAGEAGSHLQILDYKNFTYAEKTGGPLRSVSDRDIIGVLTWRRVQSRQVSSIAWLFGITCFSLLFYLYVCLLLGLPHCDGPTLVQNDYADYVLTVHRRTRVTSTTDNVDNSADPYEDASNGDLGGNSSGGIPSGDLSVGVMIADKADAQPKTSASHVEVEPEPETKEQVQKGPYIFASCHEDVLEYLQPQYVCLCLPGSAPRLLKNPHEGQLPSLHATITGVTEPIGHHLVGSWMPKNKKIQPFLITHKASVKPNQFTVFFEGGGKIAWLGQEADGTFVGSGKIMGTTKTMRITSLSPYELSLELDKGEPVKAERRRMPASHQIHALTADPEDTCQIADARCAAFKISRSEELRTSPQGKHFKQRSPGRKAPGLRYPRHPHYEHHEPYGIVATRSSQAEDSSEEEDVSKIETHHTSKKNIGELQKENAKFKMLYDMQQQLIATMQEQLRVQAIGLDSMKQERELASLRGQAQTMFDAEKRQLQKPDEAGGTEEAKSLEKLKSKLTKMSADKTLYREQADAHATCALATSVQAGWKAACTLPHESTLPLRTSVGFADKTEVRFVEWLFTRSLVKHRSAQDPSLWCPTARVKVLQVEKIENRHG